MAIVANEGNPSFFINLIENPQWGEVKQHLRPDEKPEDRFDYINRIFSMKLTEFLKDVNNGVIGGPVSLIMVT